MRIISGIYKGLRLDDFKGKHIRPTTDRARESLFNILSNSNKLKREGFDIKNSVFVDAFCGTGAVGIEAFSRGANEVIFIDINNKSLQITKDNINKIDRIDDSYFIKTDLTKKISTPPIKPNIIFLDPPYGKDMLRKALENFIKNEWIDKDCFVVLEYEENDTINFLENFKILETRQYGKNNFLMCKIK